MDFVDGSYLAGVSMGGAIARALRRGLPTGWRMRLEARLPTPTEPWIWLHAVSVGELMLAEGVLGYLLQRGHRVHITTGTPAGLNLLQTRLAQWDQGRHLLSGGAFPLDDPRGLRPFFAFPPCLFLALETEIWPNLLRELEKRQIPRVIVNGRLTARSLGRGGAWLRRAASRLSLVVARDPESQGAFSRLGAPRVALGGNLKADAPPPPPLHEGWQHLRQGWQGCPILVAGNTLPGEEALILAAWERLRHTHFPSLKLILAPRQPKRFAEVAACLHERQVAFFQASSKWREHEKWPSTDVLLLDTLGELSAAYGEGTVALVGGGWTWQGGHNPMEPVRWGMPTLIGPGYDNFADLAIPLRDAGHVQVVSQEQLFDTLVDFFKKTPLRPALMQKKVALPLALKDTLERSCHLISEFLPAPRQ